jgi:hypothetical protein
MLAAASGQLDGITVSTSNELKQLPCPGGGVRDRLTMRISRPGVEILELGQPGSARERLKTVLVSGGWEAPRKRGVVSVAVVMREARARGVYQQKLPGQSRGAGL